MRKALLTLAMLVAAGPALAQFGGGEFGNAQNSPRVYSPNGQYLGTLNSNQFDPDSVSNQFGKGSQFAPNGLNNQFSPNYQPGLARRYRDRDY